MSRQTFLSSMHKSTARDYLARVNEIDKAEAADVACRFGYEYWDGDRLTGYGGYKYDGRWRPVAEAMSAHYGLEPGMRVLDVGCGKGFLLFDLTEVVPGLEVFGIDISEYAIEHANEDVRNRCRVASADKLPFANEAFDLVISINTLHNLYNYELSAALREIERVGRRHKYCALRPIVMNERR